MKAMTCNYSIGVSLYLDWYEAVNIIQSIDNLPVQTPPETLTKLRKELHETLKEFPKEFSWPTQ